MLAVKQDLKAKLLAMPILATADVQITHGFPKDPRRTFAFVGEASMQRIEWMTNRSREEEFAVTVGFATMKTNGTGEAVEAHLVAVAAAFEEALDADPGLGGLCITTRFHPKRLGSQPAGKGDYEGYLETEVVAVCRP